MKRIFSALSGENIAARALRGVGFTVGRFGSNSVLRLVSNLILTRLLFPEVFGLMAIVQIFMTGLQMFSDIGINTSIIQSKRGDDPDFLNTAWTLKIMRGFVLWLAACALAPLAAYIYDEELLLQLLPVVGLNALISGFTTTKVAAANRHLRLGRQTVIGVSTQVIGIATTVFLAWLMQSVWALVIGGLVSSLLQTIIMHIAMPGVNNRLRFEMAAVREIFGFGQFIFLSTLAGFIINQGDRAILGAFVSMADLGIYNIGFFLGTVTLNLTRSVGNKVVFPLYRMRPPMQSKMNRQKIFRTRRMLSLATIGVSAVLAFGGPYLTDIMYDQRYALAGPIVTLFSLAIVPQMVLDGYTGVFLSNGDSRRFFILLSLTAAIQTLYLYFGIQHFGIFAAVLSPALAVLTTYPLRIHFVRRYKAWDLVGDFGLLSLGLAINGIACWMHWDLIVQLIK